MAARFSILPLILFLVLGACGNGAALQANGPRKDLYACEGCEAVYERTAESLSWSARIADPEEPGEPLIASGTVFGVDGVTPQAGVVLYIHQTNAEGLYAGGSDESEWSRRNGKLHGWVRTGADGRYRFETVKPAPYPDRTMPAHIHINVLEPGRRPYYVDDIVFAGEFKVDSAYRAAQELRGGSGIVTLSRSPDGILHAKRDIILERHPVQE